MGKNVGASVLARLKTLSKETGINVPVLVRRYAQERLVYRLSVSDEASSFCLKGGLLLSLYNGGDLLRPTDDVDFNGFDENGDVHKLERSLKTALSVEVDDDGVQFLVDSMRIAKDRTGVVAGGKVSLVAMVGTARTEVRVDVGFGNPVTPQARTMEIPSLLPGVAPRPVISAYPLETVVAEKMHAMAQFGAFNTRIKDYYDVWMLLRLQPFSSEDLVEAVRNTFAHQRRPIPNDFDALNDSFIRKNAVAWSKFMRLIDPGQTATLDVAVAEIREFIDPVLAQVRGQAIEIGDWTPTVGWRP